MVILAGKGSLDRCRKDPKLGDVYHDKQYHARLPNGGSAAFCRTSACWERPRLFRSEGSDGLIASLFIRPSVKSVHVQRLLSKHRPPKPHFREFRHRPCPKALAEVRKARCRF